MNVKASNPIKGPGVAIPMNTAVGDRTLCAWQPVGGIVWVQTRSPRHARRMAQRQDGRLVAYGVAGGYLKTFEFQRSLGWAVRLVNRYIAAERTTNEALGRAICPETNPDCANGRLGMEVALEMAGSDRATQREVFSAGGSAIYA